MIITIKIDVKKIDKELLYKGEKGLYLNCLLHDHPNEYGDAGFITQDIGKERRVAGERGPIIGNFRHLETKPPAPRPPAPKAPAPSLSEDEIPW